MVPFWATLDLGQTCAVTKAGRLLGGIRPSRNIQNIADRDPPIVRTHAGSSYGGYDASNANIFGRIFTLQMTKAF